MIDFDRGHIRREDMQRKTASINHDSSFSLRWDVTMVQTSAVYVNDENASRKKHRCWYNFIAGQDLILKNIRDIRMIVSRIDIFF